MCHPCRWINWSYRFLARWQIALWWWVPTLGYNECYRPVSKHVRQSVSHTSSYTQLISQNNYGLALTSAAYLHLGWLTDCALHWTQQNCRYCTTRLLSNRIDSMSKKPPWLIKFSNNIYPYVFQGHRLCVIRKSLTAFIITYTLQKATHLTISAKWCYISEKLPILAASLRFVASCAVNPCENSYKPLLFRNYSLLDTFSSLTVKAYVHSVTYGQLWKPQHAYIKQAIC